MTKQTVQHIAAGLAFLIVGCSTPAEETTSEHQTSPPDMSADASPSLDSRIKESDSTYGNYELELLGGEVVVYAMEMTQLDEIAITPLTMLDQTISTAGKSYRPLSAYNLTPSPKNFTPPIALKFSLNTRLDALSELDLLSRTNAQDAWSVHQVDGVDSEVMLLEDENAVVTKMSHFSDHMIAMIETEEEEMECGQEDPTSYCPPGGLLAPLKNWTQSQPFAAHPDCDGADFVNGDTSAELLAPATCEITDIVSDYNDRCSSTGTHPECANCFFSNCSFDDYTACTNKGCTEYGNYIKCRLETNATQQILMAHASSIAPGLTQGIVVERGDTMGVIGNTGRVIPLNGGDGTHLHMGLSRESGFLNSLDPVPCLLIDVDITKPSPNSTITLGQGFDVEWELSEAPQRITIAPIESANDCYDFSGPEVSTIASPEASGSMRVVINEADLPKSARSYKGLKLAVMNSNGHWSCSQVPVSVVGEEMPPDPVETTEFSIGIASPSANTTIELGEDFTLGWSASKDPKRILVELIKSDTVCLAQTGISLYEINSPAKNDQIAMAISGSSFVPSQDVPGDYKAIKVAAQDNTDNWVCDLVPITLEDDWPDDFYNSVGQSPPSGPLQGAIQYIGDEDVLSMRIGGGIPRDMCVFTTGNVDLECIVIADDRDEQGAAPPQGSPMGTHEGSGPCAMDMNNGRSFLVQVKIKGRNGSVGAYTLDAESLSNSTHCSP